MSSSLFLFFVVPSVEFAAIISKCYQLARALPFVSVIKALCKKLIRRISAPIEHAHSEAHLSKKNFDRAANNVIVKKSVSKSSPFKNSR